MLKPGQTTLHRDYYKNVTTEKPDGEGVLKNYDRFKSVYDQSQNQNVKLGDYKVPAKSMNTMTGYELVHKPQLFNHTALGRKQMEFGKKQEQGSSLTLTAAGDKVAKNINPASHWGSSYKQIVHQVENGERNPSQRPTWSINRVAYSSGRGNYTTEFKASLGGAKPRDILNQDSECMENRKDELTAGSTKVTSHIPGYNGFIPSQDINESAVNQAKGQAIRNTIIKQNISENYNVKIPGYAGVKPMSVINDRGSLRGSCFSTAGETFN